MPVFTRLGSDKHLFILCRRLHPCYQITSSVLDVWLGEVRGCFLHRSGDQCLSSQLWPCPLYPMAAGANATVHPFSHPPHLKHYIWGVTTSISKVSLLWGLCVLERTKKNERKIPEQGVQLKKDCGGKCTVCKLLDDRVIDLFYRESSDWSTTSMRVNICLCLSF